MKSPQLKQGPKTRGRNMTRRSFIQASAAGGAALMTGGLASLFKASAIAAKDFPVVEASITQLQAAMAAGRLSAKDLVHAYLRRIKELDPALNSVIETNPDADAIAAHLDKERKSGYLRGPLHGIPLLVKDNIATLDHMETTAGSLALVGSRVPDDAPLIRNLRAAGAIILGKANLGEWANFRGFNGSYPQAVGWSARGGDTKNSYDLSYTSFGSSSGSAAAVAASLCAAAVGTETDGSITGPSCAQNIYGLKPTVGLISQQGIIPISHRQDTAGPMGRTVGDVAILLSAMQTPFGAVAGQPLPSDYTQFLQPGALQGKRIGRDARFFDYSYAGSGIPGDEETVAFAEHALDVMESLGATIVDTDTGDIFAYFGDEFTALLFEFKAKIAEYLQTLSHTRLRDVSDLIAFNNAHCAKELVYYGQEIFELAEAQGNLNDPAYLAARNNATNLARTGIDGAMQRDNLDAIVAPHLTNTNAPAVAGYPNLAIPIGIRASGRPAGMLMYSGFLREPQILAMAYALEQALPSRRIPQFLNEAVEIPNAGLCSDKPPKPRGRPHPRHNRVF